MIACRDEIQTHFCHLSHAETTEFDAGARELESFLDRILFNRRPEVFVISDDCGTGCFQIEKLLSRRSKPFVVHSHRKDQNLIYAVMAKEEADTLAISVYSSLRRLRAMPGWREPACDIPFGTFLGLGFEVYAHPEGEQDEKEQTA